MFREYNLRGVMLRFTDEGKSVLIGSRPGMAVKKGVAQGAIRRRHAGALCDVGRRAETMAGDRSLTDEAFYAERENTSSNTHGSI